jgi:hypothetical protein
MENRGVTMSLLEVDITSGEECLRVKFTNGGRYRLYMDSIKYIKDEMEMVTMLRDRDGVGAEIPFVWQMIVSALEQYKYLCIRFGKGNITTDIHELMKEAEELIKQVKEDDRWREKK